MRHAAGYIELRRYRADVRIAAVCDPHLEAAQTVARAIADATSHAPNDAPQAFPSLEAALAAVPDIRAVDIVTSTPAHHRLAIEAMDAGLHVMVEKPMGLTLAACRMMQAAEHRSGKTLAVAENFRRDPMNRLARALLDAGAIGKPYFALDFGIASANRGVMHSTVWRAKRDQAGGVVLDAGVHNADLLLYLMGPAERVYAETDVFDPDRVLRPMSEQAPGLAAMYTHRAEAGGETVGDRVEQDAVDTAFASIRFATGAIGQLAISDAAHGYQLGESVIVGSHGTMFRPPSRSGVGPRIVRPDGTAISGDALLELVPDFELDDITAAMWDGARRMASYDLDFRRIDAKIIAVEYLDFAAAINGNRPPEVGSREGMDALALAYGIMESGAASRAVSIADVADGSVRRFQSDIDRAAGIA